MTGKIIVEGEYQLLGTVVAVQANYYRVRLEVGEYNRLSKQNEQHHKQKQDKGKDIEGNLPTTHYPSPITHDPLPLIHSELLCTRRTRLKKIGQQVMVAIA